MVEIGHIFAYIIKIAKIVLSQFVKHKVLLKQAKRIRHITRYFFFTNKWSTTYSNTHIQSTVIVKTVIRPNECNRNTSAY